MRSVIYIYWSGLPISSYEGASVGSVNFLIPGLGRKGIDFSRSVSLLYRKHDLPTLLDGFLPH